MLSAPLVLLPQPERDQAERVWLVPCMKSGVVVMLFGRPAGLDWGLGAGVAVVRRGRRRRGREARGVYMIRVGVLVIVLGENGFGKRGFR